MDKETGLSLSDIDFHRLGRLIFSDKTPINAVSQIIDRNCSSVHYPFQKDFLVQLTSYLGRFKMPTISLVKKEDKITVLSDIEGVLLHKSTQMSDWEPMAIVGPSDYPALKVINSLAIQMDGRDDNDRLDIFLEFNEKLKKEQIEVFIPKQYPNTSDNTVFTCIIPLNEKVLKNGIVGYMEYYDFTTRANNFIQKQFAAYSHIALLLGRKTKVGEDEMKQAINLITEEILSEPEGRITNSQPVAKKQPVLTDKKLIKTKKLIDIWAPNKLEKYHTAISFLKEPRVIDEREASFIYEENETLYWHKLISQKYLAGFICKCIMRGYIKDIYTAPELIAICKNTFNITTLDKNNFTNITENDRLKSYHTGIFRDFDNMFPNE